MSELNINVQNIRKQLADYKKSCDEQISAKADAEELWEEIEKLLGSIISREYDLKGMESIIFVVNCSGETFKRGNREYYKDFLITIYNDSLMAQTSAMLSSEDLKKSEVRYSPYNGKIVEAESISILRKKLEGEYGYEDVLEKMRSRTLRRQTMVLAFQINLT